jgi:hypothetical protein
MKPHAPCPWIAATCLLVPLIGCSTRHGPDGGLEPWDGSGGRDVFFDAPVRDAADAADPDTAPPMDAAPMEHPVPVLFAYRAGDRGEDMASSVAVDGMGRVYLTGTAIGPVDLGGGVLEATALVQQVFVASYTAEGMHRWSHQFRRTSALGFARLSEIAVDAAGDVALSGVMAGTFEFAGTELEGPEEQASMFVLRLTADGALLWARVFGRMDCADCRVPVALYPSGDVALAAPLQEQVEFGALRVPAAAMGTSAALVARLAAADGRGLWGRTLVSLAGVEVRSLAVDGAGDVTVAGSFLDAVDLGARTERNTSGLEQIVLVTYDGLDGSPRWSTSLGSAEGPSRAYAVGFLPTSTLLLAGTVGPHGRLGERSLENEEPAPFVAAFRGGETTPRWTTLSARNVSFRAVGALGDDAIVGGTLVDEAVLDGHAVASTGGTDLLVLRLAGSDGATRFVQSVGGRDDERGYGIAAGPGGLIYAVGSMRGTVVTSAGTLVSAGSSDALFVAVQPE